MWSVSLEETPESLLFSLSTMWAHSEKVAIYKPWRELSPESELARALILDF